METLSVKLNVKSLDEQGRFAGLASVFGNVDLGGDVVVAGAFSKSLSDRGSEVPILWQHDTRSPIGLGKLKETNSGLLIEGQLVMSVSRAREAYDLMKARVLKGLSIGYDTVKSDVQGGIRYLKELKLFEVSLVSIPMNEMATVQMVKGSSNLDAHIRQLADEIRNAREAWR
jgi:uncharacterized protein